LASAPRTFAESANSDVVVITSGMPRKPGMSRDDLLNVNYKIMQDVTVRDRQALARTASSSRSPTRSTPCRRRCSSLSKFPRERVIGMAGVLTQARMSTFIAMESDVSVENVSSFVLGGHGDTMVPLPRYTTVAGIPITSCCPRIASRRSASAPPTAAPRSPSWSARAPGMRRARRRR
jgi:malate dehydrogenase